MIRNLIFDLDGTIADDYEEMLSIFTQISHKYTVSKNLDRTIKHYKQKGTEWLLKKLNIPEEKYVDLVRELLQNLNRLILNTKAQNGLESMLGSLKDKKIRLGLLTSNNEENINIFLKNNKLNKFEFIYPNAKLFSKSDLLKKILYEHKLKKGETAYVGDEDRDIIAAKQAGLKSIAVSWGFNSKNLLINNKPDFIADKPSEILKAITQI